MPRLATLFILAALLSSSVACAVSVRRIADLQRNPSRYQDRTVNINGVVTTSWGVPLVPYRFYKVGDGTGELTVLSTSSRMPVAGARVHVKGRVENIAVVGGQPIGLHLREESLDIRRR